MPCLSISLICSKYSKSGNFLYRDYRRAFSDFTSPYEHLLMKGNMPTPDITRIKTVTTEA